MTPTRGSAPYVFSASFLNKQLADNVYYSIEVTTEAGNLSCPSNVNLPDINSIITNAFRNGDQYTRTANVIAGQCYTMVLRIRNLKTGEIVQSMLTSINNI